MSRSLKIAFDAKRLFHNREGLGSYARTLVSDLKTYYPEHQYYLCSPSVSEAYCDASFFDPENFTILTAPKGTNPSWWRSRGILKVLQEHKIDVYFGLSNELPFGIEKLDIRTVVTIHDMLYRTFPQQFSLIDRWIYGRKFKHATKVAKAIIATSKHTKTDIVEYHKVDPGKIESIYQAVPPPFRQLEAAPSAMGEYYLSVGTVSERKNQLAIVEAYNLLEKSQRRPVFIVGRGTRYITKLKSKIQEYGLETYFHFKENIETEELIKLYQQARALIFPSKYEGFGIPIMEALSVGIPVIAIKNSSIPEVLSKYGIIIEYDSPVLLNEAILLMNKENFPAELLSSVEKHLLAFDPEIASHSIMKALKGDKSES